MSNALFWTFIGVVTIVAIAFLAWLDDRSPEDDRYEPGVLESGALKLMTTDDEREMRRELESARRTMLAKNAGRNGGIS